MYFSYLVFTDMEWGISYPLTMLIFSRSEHEGRKNNVSCLCSLWNYSLDSFVQLLCWRKEQKWSKSIFSIFVSLIYVFSANNNKKIIRDVDNGQQSNSSFCLNLCFYSWKLMFWKKKYGWVRGGGLLQNSKKETYFMHQKRVYHVITPSSCFCCHLLVWTCQTQE